VFLSVIVEFLVSLSFYVMARTLDVCTVFRLAATSNQKHSRAYVNTDIGKHLLLCLCS